MFEITYNDDSRLGAFVEARKAYKGAIYDFTFEDRFIIYHCDLVNVLTYIALDKKTGNASEILRKRPGNYIKPSEYRAMMPKILESIKYTGDRRYEGTMSDRPMEVIDSIFRVILPEYGYVIREEQIVLSKAMYRGLTEKSVSVCEAEVGTGKTLSYLVAALVAKNSRAPIYGSWKPITITTSSIELQKALVEKEIPRLSRMLKEFGLIERPLTAILRKGKEHYFCRFRCEDFVNGLKQAPQKHVKLIAALESEAFLAKVFDLDKLKVAPSIKSKICVKGSCASCKYRSECKYHSFISAACGRGDLDFQVTNHNLYLTAAKMCHEGDVKLLRPSNYVVVDEAHKLKEAATDVFGAKLSEKDIDVYVNVIKHLAKSGCSMQCFRRNLQLAKELNTNLFGRLYKKIEKDDADEGRGTLIHFDDELRNLLKALIDTIEQLEASRKKVSGQMENIGEEILRILQSFVRTNNINIWVENDENNLTWLCNSAKSIDTVLYENLWSKDVSHVLTSGTMSDGFDFAFFDRENGIDRVSHHLVQHRMTESPFAYDRNARLYMPKGMPIPNNDSPEYINAISKKIMEVIEATNGHTAILFTSYKVLSQVYTQIAEKLGKYEVFRMTRKDNTVIGEFKKSKNGVLFASGSMWEGIDCVGDCLSSVIVVRLPFPIRSAVLEQKKDECENVPQFIRTYAVPEMLIKLRQGVGRLIRSETDTGLVTILDPRAREGFCAAKVRHALRKYPLIYSAEEIKDYFKAVKPVDYFEGEQ